MFRCDVEHSRTRFQSLSIEAGPCLQNLELALAVSFDEHLSGEFDPGLCLPAVDNVLR
jgi:hypothetical protein